MDFLFLERFRGAIPTQIRMEVRNTDFYALLTCILV